MKTCPFCAEEIRDEAIKCKHCGSMLDGSAPHTNASDRVPGPGYAVVIVTAMIAAFAGAVISQYGHAGPCQPWSPCLERYFFPYSLGFGTFGIIVGLVINKAVSAEGGK